MSFAKIALEEHVDVPKSINGWQYVAQQGSVQGEKRPYTPAPVDGLLALMDANGIEMSVLSLTQAAVECIPVKELSVRVARDSNDYIAEQVTKNPKRLQAWATLPMLDPEAASLELVRCVKELGFKGTMVKGFCQVGAGDQVAYYDQPEYDEFWATVASLDVPFYLHPRYPMPHGIQSIAGHSWFRGSVWGFGVETATHTLRLMASGIFDRYPKLTVILGHLGETLPNAVWRIDHRLAKEKQQLPAQKKFAEYLRNNFYLTTSGNFCTHTLQDTIAEVGADRILFSVDYPYESVEQAAKWFDSCEISEANRLKIGRSNAEKLLKMSTAASA